VFDAALIRDFRLGERTNLEFRWEVFNITSTPLFGQPNANFSSAAQAQLPLCPAIRGSYSSPCG
jgi:hypothetical protein